MVPVTRYTADFIAFCSRHGIDHEQPPLHIVEELFFGRLDNSHLIRGTVSVLLQFFMVSLPHPDEK